MPAPDATTSFYAATRNRWRQWLQQNSQTASYVWLIIYHKKAATPSVTYDEAVEEALCFGWIDSKPNKRDAESYYLFLAKRKPRSGWSRSNKERVEKLLAAGRMMPQGLAAIETAKANGAWTALDAVEAMEVPVELAQALKKNKKAATYFAAFPPSAKKGILQWIAAAKRPETRAARIAETVRLAAENKRAAQYQPKQKEA